MTTYQYTLKLNDSEYLYLERILAEGIAEFNTRNPDMKHHKSMAEQLFEKLKKSSADAEMTSSSYFVTQNNL